MPNHNIYVSLLSRVFSQNPYNTTGYHDRTPNSTDKSAISRIARDFGNLSQNDANFAAHISVIPVQKIMIGGAA